MCEAFNKIPVTKTLLGEVHTPFKVIFDITCGIGDFRAYIFCPPLTQELPKKHHEAGSSEQVRTYALSQIDYDYTVDTFEIAKRFAFANELRKGHFGKLK